MAERQTTIPALKRCGAHGRIDADIHRRSGVRRDVCGIVVDADESESVERGGPGGSSRGGAVAD